MTSSTEEPARESEALPAPPEEVLAEGELPPPDEDLERRIIGLAYSRSGPLPHPEELEAYSKIDPALVGWITGLADRQMQLIEREQAHRHREEVADGNAERWSPSNDAFSQIDPCKLMRGPSGSPMTQCCDLRQSFGASSRHLTMRPLVGIPNLGLPRLADEGLGLVGSNASNVRCGH
jgi:hypothetical protein